MVWAVLINWAYNRTGSAWFVSGVVFLEAQRVSKGTFALMSGAPVLIELLIR